MKKTANQICGIQINQYREEYFKIYVLRLEKNKSPKLVKPPL